MQKKFLKFVESDLWGPSSACVCLLACGLQLLIKTYSCVYLFVGANTELNCVCNI